jgi:hypothetical protein
MYTKKSTRILNKNLKAHILLPKIFKNRTKSSNFPANFVKTWHQQPAIADKYPAIVQNNRLKIISW